jgi:hypothetical protein
MTEATMARFLVSYDLRKPDRNYEPLWNRLRDWKGMRALESAWIIEWTTTSVLLRDDLMKYIDANDGLLVVKVDDAAWLSLQPSALTIVTKAA